MNKKKFFTSFGFTSFAMFLVLLVIHAIVTQQYAGMIRALIMYPGIFIQGMLAYRAAQQSVHSDWWESARFTGLSISPKMSPLNQRTLHDDEEEIARLISEIEKLRDAPDPIDQSQGVDS